MLWVKALHIISVIAWMAALLYLPRLLVYHADSVVGSEKSETFKVMERRLLRGIAMPAMIATWAFGLWMAWLIGAWSEGWLHAKLTFVVALSAYNGFLARWVREFAEDRNVRPARFYRIANEVPTLFLIAIVILVVVKPF
jgi:protoporphyrinogen IX oxidase